MNLPIDPKKILDIARELQSRIERMKDELRAMRVEADAGAGMVKVVANGMGEVLEVKIDRLVIEEGDVPMLEDLIKSAVNKALQKSAQSAKEKQSDLTGGMPLPFDISKITDIS
jgi:DNA-binding YbaB/EbfC family protein